MVALGIPKTINILLTRRCTEITYTDTIKHTIEVDSAQHGLKTIQVVDNGSGVTENFHKNIRPSHPSCPSFQSPPPHISPSVLKTTHPNSAPPLTSPLFAPSASPARLCPLSVPLPSPSLSSPWGTPDGHIPQDGIEREGVQVVRSSQTGLFLPHPSPLPLLIITKGSTTVITNLFTLLPVHRKELERNSNTTPNANPDRHPSFPTPMHSDHAVPSGPVFV